MRLESLRVLIPEVCNNKMFSIKQHPRVKKVGPVQVLGHDACMLYAATHVIGRCSEVSDEGQDSYTGGAETGNTTMRAHRGGTPTAQPASTTFI